MNAALFQILDCRQKTAYRDITIEYWGATAWCRNSRLSAMKFKPSSIRELADASSELFRLIDHDPEAVRLAAKGMVQAADLFFAVIPPDHVHLIKGRGVLQSLLLGVGLDRKVEMAAVHVNSAEEAMALALIYGDPAKRLHS